jgi:hypothetical protein
MNKKILTGIMLAATLTGCSSIDHIDTEDEKVFDVSNSNEKIKLAGNAVDYQAATRSIVNDESGMFSADSIGMFCLATARLANGRYLPIDWSKFNADNTTPGSYSVWFQNVMVDAKMAIDDYNNPYTKITWLDGITRFYPTGNGHAYSFYALWPAPKSLQFTTNAITSSVNLANGEMDVLWGECDKQAKSPTESDTLAYCAKYFRQDGKSTEIPMLTFHHQLMSLQFSILAGADADGNIDKAQRLRVTAIRIYKVPTEGCIYIASKDGQHQPGTIVCNWTNASKMATVEVEDATGSHQLTKEYWIPKTENYVGQKILLPVPPTSDYYQISVDLADKDGNVYPSAINWPLTLRSGYSYEPGHNYKVRFIIYGLSDIHLQAKMSTWVDEEQTFEDPASK